MTNTDLKKTATQYGYDSVQSHRTPKLKQDSHKYHINSTPSTGKENCVTSLQTNKKQKLLQQKQSDA